MITLSPDQIEDAIRMASTPDLPNFSKAGTGKTHTTLEAIKRFGSNSNLIIAPRIALHWWAQQAKEYLGADARVMKTGSSPLAGDVLVTTYGLARTARSRLYEHFKEGTLTLDESHNVANPEAKQTQAVFGNHADLRGGLAERFDTVWALSGTPVQNFANDLYTQTACLHPDVYERYGIKNYEQFCAKFTFKKRKQFHPNMQPVMKIVSSANEVTLQKIVYQDIGAIRREENSDLPTLNERDLVVSVKLTKELRDACKGMTEEQITSQINDPDSVIAKVWRLIGLAKVEPVVPHVGDASKSGPVLLGCWHRDVMTAYEERLARLGFRVVQVNGSTSPSKLEPIREAFNNGEIDVLVGQMKAMGTSWNLQEASRHIVLAETYPSPSVVEQFYKRVYRRGQGRNCTLDIVVADHDVDKALNEVRKRKEKSDDKINRTA